MTDLSSLETVTVAVEEGVAIVAINRPKALNAINSQVLDDLEVAFDVLAEQDVACVVLTGAGEKSFVAGADIAQMADMSPEKAQAFSKKGHDIFKKIEDF